MNATADLTLSMADGRALRGLSAVLAPDNEGLPAGVTLSISEAAGGLRIVVNSDSLSSSLSTLLSLLRDAVLFQEVWLLSTAMRA